MNGYYIAGGSLLTCAALAVTASKCCDGFTLPHTWDREHELDFLGEHGFDARSFLDSVAPEPFEVVSEDGYVLRGDVIPAPEGTSFPDGRQRAVLLVHGYSGNRHTMLSYGEIYHRMGFTVVRYDHRFHGDSDSEGLFCTMGVLESRDCVRVAEHVRQFLPADTVWGLQGESMGAASAMIAAASLPWLSFLSEDSGYTSFKAEIAPALKYVAKMPKFLIPRLTEWMLRLRRHIDPAAADALAAVKGLSFPVLFCHGGADDFVPLRMAEELYEACGSPFKRLKVFEGCEHAKAVIVKHEEYRESLSGFLRDSKII